MREAMQGHDLPPADLFDQPVTEPPRHLRAVSPLTPSRPEDETEGYLALRWKAAGIALVAAGTAALVGHFPHWAIAALALFCGGMTLWPLPRWATRAWLILAASFFFAQISTIFINTPFSWTMRFGFCAVLLTAVAVFRAAADS